MAATRRRWGEMTLNPGEFDDWQAGRPARSMIGAHGMPDRRHLSRDI